MLEAGQHLKEIAAMNEDVLRLKEKIAREIFKTKQQQKSQVLVNHMITQNELKIMKDALDKQAKDLLYLKKPSYVPQAYEQALAEIVRRKRFRTILNSDMEKIKEFVNQEK